MAIQPENMRINQDPVLMKVLQDDKMVRAELNREKMLENKKTKAREAQTKFFDQESLKKPK